LLQLWLLFQKQITFFLVHSGRSNFKTFQHYVGFSVYKWWISADFMY